MKSDNRAAPGVESAWLSIPDPLASSATQANAAPVVPEVPSPTRLRVRSRRILALAVVGLWPVAIVVATGLRHDAREIFEFLAQQTALWTALLTVCALVALSKGPRGLGRPLTTVRAASVGAAALFLLLAPFWLPGEASHAFAEVGSPHALRSCLVFGVLVALPMLAISAWALRHAFPSGAGSRGGALGAASGLAGALVLALHCGIALGGHILLAHGGALVLATLAGAWAGSKVMRA